MYLVLVTYVKPLSVIDGLLEAHIRFLEQQKDAGVILAAGRQEPRTGGLILARAESREALDAILAQDPFAVHSAATYAVTCFTPTLLAPGVAGLRDGA